MNNNRINQYSITYSKPEPDYEFSKSLMEILSLIKAKYGDNQTFTLEMGNFTSDEYGSYRMIFKDSKNPDITLCTVIWDRIFGEVKIQEP